MRRVNVVLRLVMGAMRGAQCAAVDSLELTRVYTPGYDRSRSCDGGKHRTVMRQLHCTQGLTHIEASYCRCKT